MVAKISLPEDESIEIVKRTLNERIHYKDFYNRIQADLLFQIKHYIEKCGNPKDIQPLILRDYTDSEKAAFNRKKSLIGLYSPKENKLPYLQLEKMRKKNGLVFCPCCGELGRPRTLDHYLPKSVFPEFSIVLLNLTPMCDWCQGEKLQEYVTQDGKKRYIHPYFDDVNQPLFSITFEPPYSSPIIYYEIKDNLPIELQELVELHLEGINFIERYKAFFKSRYTSILRRAQDGRLPNRTGFRDSLNLFLEMESEKAINSWDAILYRSILEDEALMIFLESEQLPDNL